MEVARGVTKTSGSFFKGLEAGLSRLLVSPSFIFRLDSVEADPGKPGHVRLDGYSLATRISFLLWDAPPDEELLDAAGNRTAHRHRASRACRTDWPAAAKLRPSPCAQH